ncbi:MAG TPA: QueG-associated DUF1730 domain-containing protein, partial [Longimicrobiales bacterium]|nr:QueG-associated DUF1730 domain-containing protein [Longimicrobiales bacterium]
MPESLARRLKDRARGLGLAAAGITPARPSDHGPFLRGWLDAGMAGEMTWLGREEAVARRIDPARTLRDVRSVVVVADPYPADDPEGIPHDPALGVIARYARGRDYHKVLRGKLETLARWLDAQVEGSGA